MNNRFLTISELTKKMSQHGVDPSQIVAETIRDVQDQYGEFFTSVNISCQGFQTSSLLNGIPFVLTENYCTKSNFTSCGTKMLTNYISPFDAHIVQCLCNAGGTWIGKLKIPEFGLEDFDTKYEALDYSVTSVKEGIVPFSLCCNTNGTLLRQGAENELWAFCPSSYTISQDGFIAASPSLQRAAILSRSYIDCEIVFSFLKDSTISAKPVESLRIGASPDYDMHNLQRQKIGIDIQRIPSPNWRDSVIPACHALCAIEATSFLARFDGIRFGNQGENCNNLSELYVKSRSEGLGKVAKQHILLGTSILDANPQLDLQAAAVRKDICRYFAEVFSFVHVIIAPADSIWASAATLANVSMLSFSSANGSPILLLCQPHQENFLFAAVRERM